MNGPKQTTLPINWKYSPTFRRVYVTDLFGLVGNFDYRLIVGRTNVVLQEDTDRTPSAEGQFEMEIMVPFAVLKELKNRLEMDIELVEKRFGQITIPVSPDDRLVA